MSHIDDIATPGRMKRPGAVMLMTPIMLLAAWFILNPHHGAQHLTTPPGLAATR